MAKKITMTYEKSTNGGSTTMQVSRAKEEPLEITSNGERDVSDYMKVNVNVAAVGSVPTGNIEITENGEHDVSAYATATVNVEGTEHGNLTITENNGSFVLASNEEGQEVKEHDTVDVFDGSSGIVVTLDCRGRDQVILNIPVEMLTAALEKLNTPVAPGS